jgi:hypothetical protein
MCRTRVPARTGCCPRIPDSTCRRTPDRARPWALPARPGPSRPVVVRSTCRSLAAPRNNRLSPEHMCRTRALACRLCRPKFADSTGRPVPSDRSRPWALPARLVRSRPPAAQRGPSRPRVVRSTCRFLAAPQSSRSSPEHTCRSRPGRRAWHPRIADSTGRPTTPDSLWLAARLVARPAAPSSLATNRGKIPAFRSHPDRGFPQGPARPAHGRASHGAVGTRWRNCPRPARKETMRSASQARSQGARARRLECIAPQGCPHDTQPAICRILEYQKTDRRCGISVPRYLRSRHGRPPRRRAKRSRPPDGYVRA